MKAVFFPSPPRPSSKDRLTAPIGKLPVGTYGKLRAVTDEELTHMVGVTVLEGESLSSIAAANGIALAPLPQPVPKVVPLWRIRTVARMAGLFDQINDTIDALPEGPQKTAIFAIWNEGTEIHRDSPTVAALSAQLGLSSDAVDALFRQAASLPI